MVCYLRFMKLVKEYLKDSNATDQDAKQILEDIEHEVGHDVNLIKAVVDTEKQGLIKRLKRKQKNKPVESVAYS